jgi:DNA-binding response OmpR family regulator
MASCLRNAGYLVDSVESGEMALERLGLERYSLLVTDIGLAGLDGLALLKAARQADAEIEIIVITGAATVESAIVACNSGAARYLRKPLHRGELEDSVAVALERRRERVEQAGILRQLGSQLLQLAEGRALYAEAPLAHDNPILRVGELSIDVQRYEVSAYGQPVQLSSIQFNLLLYLARRCEQVITSRELVRKVLGYECDPAQAGELLKTHVYNLRQKIERNPAAPRLLLSRRGVGYLITAGAAAE